MNIAELIKNRNQLNDDIKYQVHQFLVKLHAVGEFAPTITRIFGGGHDEIEEIAVNGDLIVLSCSNHYRDNIKHYKLSYPINLINELNDASIASFAQEQKQIRENKNK